MTRKILVSLLLSGSLLLSACDGKPPTSSSNSGVTVTAISEGVGDSPTANDVALVNYKGTLPDGTVFDSGENAVLPLNGIITGLSEALQKMKKGGIYITEIPAPLAYGNDRVGPIPPNSNLKFEIKLIDFRSISELQKISESSRRSMNKFSLSIPKIALQCGGDGYRNTTIVLSPDDSKIYSASIIDEQKMESSRLWDDNGKIRAIMGKNHELIIDPKNLNSYRENSNYSPTSEEDERACNQAIREAEYDCADASNFRKCMSIRYPQQLDAKDYGSCRIQGARWQEFDCDVIDQSEYNDTLELVKSFENYKF